MKFDEALKAMRMGSKVARESWRDKRVMYWFILERRPGMERLYSFSGIKYKYMLSRVSTDDILADDWELVV